MLGPTGEPSGAADTTAKLVEKGSWQTAPVREGWDAVDQGLLIICRGCGCRELCKKGRLPGRKPRARSQDEVARAAWMSDPISSGPHGPCQRLLVPRLAAHGPGVSPGSSLADPPQGCLTGAGRPTASTSSSITGTSSTISPRLFQNIPRPCTGPDRKPPLPITRRLCSARSICRSSALRALANR